MPQAEHKLPDAQKDQLPRAASYEAATWFLLDRGVGLRRFACERGLERADFHAAEAGLPAPRTGAGNARLPSPCAKPAAREPLPAFACSASASMVACSASSLTPYRVSRSATSRDLNPVRPCSSRLIFDLEPRIARPAPSGLTLTASRSRRSRAPGSGVPTVRPGSPMRHGPRRLRRAPRSYSLLVRECYELHADSPTPGPRSGSATAAPDAGTAARLPADAVPARPHRRLPRRHRPGSDALRCSPQLKIVSAAYERLAWQRNRAILASCCSPESPAAPYSPASNAPLPSPPYSTQSPAS
jgi:hypothetical protein